MDLTKYSSVHAKVEVVGLSTAIHNNRNVSMKVLTKSGDIIKSQPIRKNAEDDLGKGIEEFSIDLSGLTDTTTYISFDSNSYIIKVYEVWLENKN